MSELFSAPAVDLIVEGTVENIEYRHFEAFVSMTAMTVSVAHDARGDAGPEVTVLESGGFVPISELTESERETFVTNDGDGFVEYLPSGNAPHPRVGDQVVLFLWENPAGGDLAGTYYEVGDSLGRFTLNADGDYERAGHETGYERILTQEQLDDEFRAID